MKNNLGGLCVRWRADREPYEKSHTGVPKKFAVQGISIPSFDYLQVYYKDISLFLRHPDTQKGWGKQKLF
jgi:hypothetical protein